MQNIDVHIYVFGDIMSYTSTSLGRALASARQSVGWNQRDLAKQAGTTQARISKIENGETDAKVSTLIELTRSLGLELVLVPVRHLSAVNAIVRQDRAEVSMRSARVLISSLMSELTKLRHYYPENEDLRILDRASRDLTYMQINDQAEKTLKDTLTAVVRVSNTPALISTLNRPATQLLRLRNDLSHSMSEERSTQRPAYSLDDEDDIDE